MCLSPSSANYKNLKSYNYAYSTVHISQLMGNSMHIISEKSSKGRFVLVILIQDPRTIIYNNIVCVLRQQQVLQVPLAWLRQCRCVELAVVVAATLPSSYASHPATHKQGIVLYSHPR